MKRFIPILIVALLATSVHAQLPHGVPDFGARPTSTVAESGELTDVSVTGPDSVVYVPAGVDVTITHPTEVHTLAVAGTLVTSAELRCVNLLTYEGSEWQGGDGTEIVIRDVSPSDPSEWGTGVLCFGKVYLSGTTRVPHLRAIGDLTAGQTVIDVADPADWQVGDEVVVPDVRQLFYRGAAEGYHQHERFHITAVDETSITLSGPLAMERLRPYDTDGNPLASIPLINLTRGIVIRSENPDGARGHFACVHRADVRLAGVEFADLGRTEYQLNSKLDQQSKTPTNQIGRYGGPHLHHVPGPESSHNGYQWEISGCSVHDVNKMGWGYVVHQTHYGIASSNVFWSPGSSSGFVTEDGPEYGNEFVGNVSGGGFAAYWMVGPRNTYLDNVSLSGRYGWEFGEESGGNQLWSYPLNPGDDPNLYVDMREKDQPVLAFDGNETLACEVAYIGWETGSEITTEDQPLDFVLRNSLSWNIRQGVNGYYMNNLRLEDCTLHSQVGGGLGNVDDNYATAYSGRECVIMELVRCRTFGQVAGVHYRPRGEGSRLRVTDCEFHNRVGIEFRSIQQEPRFGDIRTTVSGCTFGPRHTGEVFSRIIMGGVGNRILVPHTVELYGLEGEDIRAYWSDQAPDFVIPDANGVPPEVVGLTNQEAWDQHGVAVCGAVAPTTTHPLVEGGFAVLIGEPPPPDPTPDPKLVEVLLHDGLTVDDVTVDVRSVDPDNVPITVEVSEVP